MTPAARVRAAAPAARTRRRNPRRGVWERVAIAMTTYSSPGLVVEGVDVLNVVGLWPVEDTAEVHNGVDERGKWREPPPGEFAGVVTGMLETQAVAQLMHDRGAHAECAQ